MVWCFGKEVETFKICLGSIIVGFGNGLNYGGRGKWDVKENI